MGGEGEEAHISDEEDSREGEDKKHAPDMMSHASYELCSMEKEVL